MFRDLLNDIKQLCSTSTLILINWLGNQTVWAQLKQQQTLGSITTTFVSVSAIEISW